MKDLPDSLTLARELKSKFYYNGRPCIKGHDSKKYTSGGKCYECSKIFSASKHKKEYDKKYNEENFEKVSKRRKEYYHKNREKRIQDTKNWQSLNVEKVRIYKQNNKHKRRSVKREGISSKELSEWIKKQTKVCYWCDEKCPKDFHVDHYIPLSKNGEHKEDNLVISCRICNLRKSDKDPILWANENGKLL